MIVDISGTAFGVFTNGRTYWLHYLFVNRVYPTLFGGEIPNVKGLDNSYFYNFYLLGIIPMFFLILAINRLGRVYSKNKDRKDFEEVEKKQFQQKKTYFDNSLIFDLSKNTFYDNNNNKEKNILQFLEKELISDNKEEFIYILSNNFCNLFDNKNLRRACYKIDLIKNNVEKNYKNFFEQ